MTPDTVLRLGPLNIPIMWLLFAASAAVGGLAAVLLSRGRRSIRQRVWDGGLNAILAYFIVWKLSPLATSLSTIIRSPLALLYLPGGSVGVVAGVVAALVVIAVTVYRTGAVERLRVGMLLLVWAAVVAAGSGVGLLALSAAPSAPKAAAHAPGSGEEASSVPDRGSARQIGGNPGDTAPPFSLARLTGGSGGPGQEDSGGQAPLVVLNFWATWCPPCRAEIPELDRFARSLAGSGAGHSTGGDRVRLYLVNLTSSEHPGGSGGSIADSIRSFLSRLDADSLAPHVLLDAEGAVARLYHIESVPTTIVIRYGRVETVHPGVVTADWLRRISGVNP